MRGFSRLAPCSPAPRALPPAGAAQAAPAVPSASPAPQFRQHRRGGHTRQHRRSRWRGQSRSGGSARSAGHRGSPGAPGAPADPSTATAARSAGELRPQEPPRPHLRRAKRHPPGSVPADRSGRKSRTAVLRRGGGKWQSAALPRRGVSPAGCPGQGRREQGRVGAHPLLALPQGLLLIFPRLGVIH